MNDASNDLPDPEERPDRPSITLAIRPDQIEHAPEKITWETTTLTNAGLPALLRFAAWHLEQGAHRLFLYLDDADPEKAKQLNRHPKQRVTLCDATYWKKRGNRPEKHQPRQTMNAAHALSRAKDVDWLLHCDVDELLWPSTRSVESRLAGLPAYCLCARVRPALLDALRSHGRLLEASIDADALIQRHFA